MIGRALGRLVMRLNNGDVHISSTQGTGGERVENNQTQNNQRLTRVSNLRHQEKSRKTKQPVTKVV